MIYDIERLQEAAGTGEVLVVVYMAGHAPGYKRRIVVVEVDVDADLLIVKDRGKRKTYSIQKTQVVSETHLAPWMPEDAGKATPVDPAKHFSGWQFAICKWHYESLGVVLREVIDKEITEAARANARAAGMEKTEATKRFKFTRHEHAIYSPMAYSFSVGDIFYRGTQGGSDWLQVSGVSAGKTGMMVEAHWPFQDGRRAHFISADVLAECLKTGGFPPDDTRLDRLHSVGLMSLRPMIV